MAGSVLASSIKTPKHLKGLLIALPALNKAREPLAVIVHSVMAILQISLLMPTDQHPNV